MFARLAQSLALVGVLLGLLLVSSCSLLRSGPICNHPSCVAHLELGSSEAEVLSGTWLDAAWHRADYFGPVGRDLTVLRGYSSVSPLAFEDNELLGWMHRFSADAWAQDDALRTLKGLQSGDSVVTVQKVWGAPDRVVAFRSEENEALEIWSWLDREIALGFTQFLQFDVLHGVEELEAALILRGYVEGFEDFRVD